MKRHQNDMLRGPIFPSIIRYSIPIILTSVLQVAFNMADMAVIGQRHGGNSVAAIGATGVLTALIVNSMIGFSVGAGICVAHGAGGRKDQEVSRTVHTAMPLAAVFGLAISVIGVIFCRNMLQLLGTPRNILDQSTLYLRIYFSGVVFTLIYNFGAAILRAVGDTQSPLIYLSASGALNVGLNLVFVFLFDMDVEGVALATVISQAFAAVMVTVTLMRRTDSCRLVLKKMRFYSRELRKILRMGFPACIQSLAFSSSNLLIQSSVNGFGSTFVSGSSAASTLEGFVYFSMNAFQHAATNFIGQNVGARQFDRVKKIGWACMVCSGVAGVLFGSAVYILGEPLLSLFIPGETQAIADGIIRLFWISFPYFLCGVMETVTGMLRGLGCTLSPTILTVSGVCIFRVVWILGVFKLPAMHHPDGLFMSYPISWLLTLIVQLIAFRILFRNILAKQGTQEVKQLSG